MDKILKSEVPRSKYYLWQTETYGKDYYLEDVKTSIYLYKPMPCTPAGLFIEEFDNFSSAFNKYKELINS